MNKSSKIVGGVLLVAGTTIGAGMLALPVVTGFAGFYPSLLLFLLFWAYMTFTAFLMLEVALWMPLHTNLITMARKTLGKTGEMISWTTYLFLLYSLTTAYIAGSGPIINDFVISLTGLLLPDWVGILPLLVVFGFFVYKGTKSVDYINRLLMLGLVVTYVMMVVFLTPYVQESLLRHVSWQSLFFAVSIVATSFGFHIIIPSLVSYLNRDVPSLRKVILIGSAIPLFVYIIWELLTLGIIPLDGPQGLKEGYNKGANGAHLLAGLLHNSRIGLVAQFFSFFAIVTSFLGVSLSLTDFLADGFKIEKTRRGRILLYLLTFTPPFIFTLIDPRAFLSALEYAGAFGVMVLLGLLPALMVWRGRYVHLFPSTFKVPGGKLALVLVVIFSILMISVEVIKKFKLG